LLLLLGVLLAAPAHAQPASPPPSEHNGFGNLTARWWQWALEQPAENVGNNNTNPIVDSTGAYATAGQENGIGPANKYFFLAGTFGGSAERTVTVPKGKALFFPLVNFEVDNAQAPPTHYTVPQLKPLAKDPIDDAAGLNATLNGQPVDIFRVVSPVFSYTVPKDNSLYDYFGLVGPQFEGRIKPVVADGYWAYIPPPAPGKYELKFSATGPVALDVTYHLTIN
jgi:hypothetical protein